jgi:hypothetical protein
MRKLFIIIILVLYVILPGCAHSHAVISLRTEIQDVEIRADWELDEFAFSLEE